MADENSPLEERLEAASTYFTALGGKMHRMADEVRTFQRIAEERDELVMSLGDAEFERDEAVERAAQLEDDIEAMRLGIRSPEEVIERACPLPS